MTSTERKRAPSSFFTQNSEIKFDPKLQIYFLSSADILLEIREIPTNVHQTRQEKRRFLPKLSSALRKLELYRRKLNTRARSALVNIFFRDLLHCSSFSDDAKLRRPSNVRAAEFAMRIERI